MVSSKVTILGLFRAATLGGFISKAAYDSGIPFQAEYWANASISCCVDMAVQDLE